MAKLGSPIENAELLLKAAEAYRQASPADAIDCINEAIGVYQQEGYAGVCHGGQEQQGVMAKGLIG